MSRTRRLVLALSFVLSACACAHAPLAGAKDADAKLEDVLARAAKVKDGRPALAIFDIDGTILDPAARTRDIFALALDGPGAVVQPELPELAGRVRALPLANMPYEPESTLAQAGIRDTAMVRALKARWTFDFFSNRFLSRDKVVPNAVPYLDSLHAHGITVVYFTGRDAPRMLGGTAQALLERGFPVGVTGTMLVMKPDKALADFDYKKNALDDLARYGTVVGVFENEPRNINLLHERFPDALAFYIDTKHSPGAPPVAAGITQLPDFTSFSPR